MKTQEILRFFVALKTSLFSKNVYTVVAFRTFSVGRTFPRWEKKIMVMTDGARRDEILPGPNSSAEGQGGEGPRQPIHSLPPPYGHKRWGGLFPRVGPEIDRVIRSEKVAAFSLLLGFVAAMVWVNLASHSYESFWRTDLSIGLAGAVFRMPLHHLVNEVLMTGFFFVAGLEIRRQVARGELQTLRQAALPLAAAAGGMILPALICWVCIQQAPAEFRKAWAVPMATDIAFALAAALMLGKRFIPAAEVFLLALAVSDDVGAVFVLGIFFSHGFAWGGLLYIFAAMLLMWGMRSVGARRLGWYLAIPLPLAWWGFHVTGVHPVLSGVLVAVLVPTEGSPTPLRQLSTPSEEEAIGHDSHPDAVLTRRFDEAKLDYLVGVSPLQRAMSGFQPIVSTFIVFLFALANAGVAFRGLHVGPGVAWVNAGVLAGLLVGKPIGILGASELVIRLGLCPRPVGMTPMMILVVGMIAGIGFTVANFTAVLAIPDAAVLATIKVTITVASVVAGMLGIMVAMRYLPKTPPKGAAETPEDAERYAAT